MSKIGSDFKKECRESKYRRDILETLLYYSTTTKNIMLPTIEELVHREIIDGVVEYITGEESKYQPYHDINLEKYMWDYFQKNLPNAKNKLEPKLENAFVKMLEPHWKSDEWGDGEHETEITLHFKGFGIYKKKLLVVKTKEKKEKTASELLNCFLVSI